MTSSRLTSDQLVFANQGLVRAIARGIHRSLPPFMELDDLISYGQLGLMQAAQDFDADRGVQFSTFAYHRIRGAILDGTQQMAFFRRFTPSRQQYERMANDTLATNAADSAGENSSATSDQASWLQDSSAQLAVVFLLSHSAEDGRESPHLEDTAARAPIQGLLDDELKDKLHALIAELPEEARSLLQGAYFEGLTLKEAGERLGISKAWASRLHARALGQLARGLRRMQVADE
ncbi:RNA polymerase sigma-D factor [Anatilimnocola aggregata]|uniref:RNA polymerase sigma-D factor n=1 Tax=Anatilimnocola aggregata TaxID=2528021 RepID=A0A517YLR1_9BACT|nr:sigma-70 family RNA polymerase sigma factor [Anatilimnocola aggregata]QDU31153.1 RNA polymerase sigma-D factor [Anatilimnocola aggregata]